MDCEPHAFTSLKILIHVFIGYMCLGVCMCVVCILSGIHVDIIRLLVGAISLLPLHRAVGHKLRKLEKLATNAFLYPLNNLTSTAIFFL